MAIEVTVALLGDRSHPFETVSRSLPEKELARPYADREKVTLEVRADEPLTDVFDRSAAEFLIEAPWEGPVSEAIAFVAFYTAEDEDRFTGPYTSELTLLDGEGRARWGVYFRDVTYGEIVRAADAGILRGDPRRPFLVIAPGHGNGMLPTWAAFLVGLDVLWKVMQAVATTEGVLAFSKRVVEGARLRLRPGREALEAHYLEWSDRGGRPDTLLDTLGQRPWASADLAEVLGCSAREAEAILWALGYTPAESGLWRRDGDEEARLLRLAVDGLQPTYGENPMQFERLLRHRAQSLLEVGQPPPEPTYEEGWPEDGDDDPEALDLPLEEGATVPCGCGRDDCAVAVEFFRSGEQLSSLKLRFTERTDHLVVDPMLFAVVLGRLAR